MEPEQVFATYTLSLIFRRAGQYQLYVAQKNIQNSILRIIAQRPFELLGKNNVFYSSNWHNFLERSYQFLFSKTPFLVKWQTPILQIFHNILKIRQSFSWEAKKFPPSMQQVSKRYIWYYTPSKHYKNLGHKKN